MPSTGFAKTPTPPYYAVIFSSQRSDGDLGYAAMAELIARARVSGWLRLRLQMWARQIDTFDAGPGARPGMLSLRIRRRDRAVAQGIAAALNTARTALPGA